MKRISIFTIAAVLSFHLAFAAETPFQLSDQAKKEAETGLKAKGWLEKFEKTRKEWEDKYGTIFEVVINSQSQVALRSKRNSGHSRSAWYYNIGLEQRLWKGASAVFEIQGGHNKGIDKLLPTFSAFNDNAWEPDYLYVNELYLQQNLFQEKVYLVAGRMDLSDWFDINEVANTSDTQFESSALTNSLNIPFPQKGLGAVAGIKPVDWFYFQVGASDAEAVSTRVGLNNCFRGTLFMSEIGFSPQLGKLKGNYRFLFHLTHDSLVERIDEQGRKVDSCGFGLSFDQQVTERITLFMRYGLADRKVSDIEHSWSAGGQITEPIKGRKDDCLGIGVAQSIVGEDYYIANDSEAAETMYEVYYNLSLHPFVKFIPNLQVVTHPQAERHAGTDIVGGVRLVIIF